MAATTVLNKETLGCHPVVWLDAMFKRLVDSEAGRGGIEVFCDYLSQIDFIPELLPLRQTMKMESTFFEAAVGRCNREMLRRPVFFRKRDVVDQLGSVCLECGYVTSIRFRTRRYRGKCPRCGGKLRSQYSAVLRDMKRSGINPKPEAVLIDMAYDRIADAFVAVYKALKLSMESTAQIFGWDRFRIPNPQLRHHLDEYRLGRLQGETKIPREEKQIIQFLTRGNRAGIPVEDAEQLIRLGTEVLKYGFMFQQLHIADAELHFREKLAEYDQLYNWINSRIRTTLWEMYAEEERTTVKVGIPQEGRYAPCFLMPSYTWESGSLSKEINLQALYRLPIFPRTDLGALQTIYGRLGSGKTFLLSSLVCYAVHSGREVVFSPLNDESNSFTYACLPLMPYSRRTRQLHDVLTNRLGVEPQGIPVLTLNFLRKGERITDLRKHPPTIFDRVVEIENPESFTLDFDLVIEELKSVSEDFGYSSVRGIIGVRNLKRGDVDVQVASNLLNLFDNWRKGNLSIPVRMTIDEVYHLAPSHIYSGDVLRSGRTVINFLKESRRSRVSIDMATQMPLEILPNIRDEATNVFFRNLAVSRDKSRSQIDFLLDSLQLSEPAVKSVVRDLNNRGLLGMGYWFWYNQMNHDIEVISPSPPTFCLQDPERTAMQLFKTYKKEFSIDVVLESWNQVERLQAGKQAQSKKKELRSFGMW
jgi:hypothetical protein